ncbi:50S ribosomal protein L17 [compost metagenome]
MKDLAPRFKTRPGGYTRIIKIGRRPGDTAEMAFLEFVDYNYETAGAQPEEKAEKKATKAAKADAKPAAKAKKASTKLVAAKKKSVKKTQKKARAAARG